MVRYIFLVVAVCCQVGVLVEEGGLGLEQTWTCPGRERVFEMDPALSGMLPCNSLHLIMLEIETRKVSITINPHHRNDKEHFLWPGRKPFQNPPETGQSHGPWVSLRLGMLLNIGWNVHMALTLLVILFAGNFLKEL